MAPRVKWRRYLYPSAATITRLIADAYRDAALAGADMRRGVDVLERLATAAADTSDPFTFCLILDGEAAQAAGSPLQSAITTLRTRYVDEMADLAFGRIEKAAAHSHAKGGQEWLRVYAEAFGEFRFELCQRLVENELCQRLVENKASFDPGPPSSFRQWTEYALAAHWNRVMPGIRYLLDHAPLIARERALLLALAAEVEIYWLGDRDAAKRQIDQAISLWPRGPRGWQSLGVYHADSDEQDDAIRAFERSTKLDPSVGRGYRGLGDIALERSDLESAERYYLRGIASAAGSADNYNALIDLYGRPELFAENESRLSLLAQRAICAEPYSEYHITITLGRTYRDNKKFEIAEELFMRAIGMFPDRWTAYQEHGFLLLNKQELARAREQFETAVQLAADTPGGYFGLGVVCELEGDWNGAVPYYEESVRHTVGRNRLPIQARLVKAYLRAGYYQLAMDTVIAAVAEHPTANVLIETIQEIAVERTKAGDQAAVADLTGRLRSILGTSSEAQYHKLLGDVAFATERYREAAEAYIRAIDADGHNADYHRSLAGTLVRLKEWSPAKDEVERAFALDKNKDVHNNNLATILNEEANALISTGDYQDAVQGYRHATELNPVDAVFHSNLSLAYEWGAQPGHRLEALEDAIGAVTRAFELSGEASYSLRLDRLKRQEAAVRRFGELILSPSVVAPIRVEFASDLVAKVDPSRGGREFLEADIPGMRERIREALGYEVPGVRLGEDADLPPGGYAIKLFNVLTARGRVLPGHLCVMPPEAAGISDFVPGQDPVTGMPCVWIQADRQAELDDVPHLSDTAFVLRHLEGVLRQHGFWFLATDEAESWISAAEESEGLEGRLAPQERVGLTRVLRALVRDGVKIDRLAEMMTAIGEGCLSPEDVPGALSRVRLSRRENLPGNAGDVVKIPVDLSAAPRSLDAYAAEGWGGLPPEEEQQLVDTITAALERDVHYALVVSEPSMRGYVWRLVESGIRQAQGRVVDVLAAREVVPREAAT